MDNALKPKQFWHEETNDLKSTSKALKNVFWAAL